LQKETEKTFQELSQFLTAFAKWRDQSWGKI